MPTRAFKIVPSAPGAVSSDPAHARQKARVPELVERDAACAELLDIARRAASGVGACVLLEGEAGVGKTSVLVWLEAMIGTDARVHWGACEALHTPRPLGPLYDMAHELGEPLVELLRSGATTVAVFDALIATLRAAPQLTVLIFEDVHWVDHGPFYLIRFLGRRVNRQNFVFILSYRHDEVSADHPLRAVIGDLPAQST